VVDALLTNLWGGCGTIDDIDAFIKDRLPVVRPDGEVGDAFEFTVNDDDDMLRPYAKESNLGFPPAAVRRPLEVRGDCNSASIFIQLCLAECANDSSSSAAAATAAAASSLRLASRMLPNVGMVLLVLLFMFLPPLVPPRVGVVVGDFRGDFDAGDFLLLFFVDEDFGEATVFGVFGEENGDADDDGC